MEINKNVEDGHEYYLTKAGTALRVKNANSGIHGMTVEGRKHFSLLVGSRLHSEVQVIHITGAVWR